MAGFSTQFGTDLLAQLGYPATAENLKFLAAWAQAEGGGAAYNPFNTTQGATGATNYNSVGVRNYTSYQQGLAATVQTLQNGRYANILSGLASGSSAMTTAQALAASPWGTGSLVVKVLGGKVTAPPPGGNVANAAAAATAAPDLNVLQTDFGFMASEINNNPDLKAWAQQYMTGAFGDVDTPIGKAKAQSALAGTTWYKTTSDSVKAWQHLQASDPAQANAKIAAAWADAHALAGQMGLENPTYEQLNLIVTKQLAEGYSNQQLQALMGGYLSATDPNSYGGKAAADLGTLQKTAASYGMTLSDGTAQNWVSRIAEGLDTTDGFTNYAKQQAKLIYPGLNAQIDQGLTVSDVAQTYQQQMASLLELDPATMDYTKDPLLQQALQYNPATAGGAVRHGTPATVGGTSSTPSSASATTAPIGTMPIYQFQQLVKNDPRWLKTDNARDSAMSTAIQIGRSWGFQ